MKKLTSPHGSLPFVILSIAIFGLLITLGLLNYGYQRDSDTAQDRLLLLEHTWSHQFENSERYHNFITREFEQFFQLNPSVNPARFSEFTHFHLDICSKTLGDSVCFLMDDQGNVLDSSNRAEQRSFVLENFKNRSYFQDALRGQPGKLAAVGLASAVPGYYFAQAVRNGKKIQNVLVIKNNFYWNSPLISKETQALVDSNGVILASNRSDMVLRTIGPFDPEIAKRLISEKIYQYIGPPILKRNSGFFWWEGFPGKIFERELKDQGLKFVVLAPLRNTVFSFFLSLLIIGIVLAITFSVWLWNSSLTRIRERMIFSDRMASIGNLAAGLAHEINNPLVVLKYNVSLFRQLPPHLLEGKLEQALIKQDEAIDRVTDIVRGLQEYTRLSSDGIGAINVHEVVSTAMTLISKVYAKEHVFIERKLQALHPWVEANSARLLQSIISLISFYRELRTERDIPRNVIIETENLHNKVRLLLKEKDTRFNPSDLGKLFEPFFPISSLGRHSLGPYIAYSLVHNMNGEIQAYIDEEGAFVFAISFDYIPLNELGE